MSSIQEQKCPCCGAPLRFHARRGKLVCDYCGTEQEIQKEKQPYRSPPNGIEGFDFGRLNRSAETPDAAALPVYNCVSCGAEVLAAPDQVALTCPYCGNHIVLTDQLSGSLRPKGLIPFRIDSEQLPEAVQRFYRDKKLLPKGFFTEGTIGQVTGVYVPFWVFSGRLHGELIFSGQTSSTRQDGDYEVTTTNHYNLIRDADITFNDLPVTASTKVDDRMMDSLEPFEMEESVPFDPRYLAGFTADRFDLEKDRVAGWAEERMRNTAWSKVASESTAGFSNVHHKSGRLKAAMDARYMLFPVYLFKLRFQDRDFHFAVNGQTGKVVGRLPIDRGRCVRHFLLRFGIVSSVLMLRSVLCYFLGV